MSETDRAPRKQEIEFVETCWDMAILPDPLLQRAFAYWDAKRAGHLLPSRADIEPTEIPGLLPNIFLVDVLYGPPRFHLRLMGTAFREWFRVELTGATFTAEGTGTIHQYFRDWSEVAAARRPRWALCNHWFDRARRDGMTWTGLVMPMAKSEDAPTDMLFGATVFARMER